MVTVIAAGGQVYDRATGTWVGETQGSVGDGVDRSVEAGRVKIWHGTDGPVGVQFVTPTPGGVANPHVATGKGGGGTGPGSAAVGGGGGTGPGSAAVVAGLLEPKLNPSHTQLMIGGGLLTHDPGWSDVGEMEERYGDSEFLNPTWFLSWGVAGADAWAGANVSSGGWLKTEKIEQDVKNAPGVLGDWLTTIGQGFLDTRAGMASPFGPDKRTPGFSTGGF